MTGPICLIRNKGQKTYQVDAVLLDFSKAFDQVTLGRLLQNKYASYYDIQRNVLGWIESFLRVRMNGVHSRC